MSRTVVTREIRPQPGPQEAFLSSPADIAIYGGAAGGGKSFALLLDMLRHSRRPGFEGVIFRRTMPEIRSGDGLWAKSEDIYPGTSGEGREHTLEWRWPSGARVAFRHMQHESDRLQYQGAAYAVIGFDELTHFTPAQFWYMVSRNRSTCGVLPYIRGTCNPDPDSFVRQLIDWWIGPDGYPIRERSGVLRWFARVNDELLWGDTSADVAALPGVDPAGIKSLTFIPASLDDNQALVQADPGYRANLLSLPYVERMALLNGNWDVRPAAGLYFRREWFQPLERPPEPHNLVTIVRAWDKAATQPSPDRPDPDWTRGVKMGLTRSGQVVLMDMVSVRGSPRSVEQAIRATAERDGRAVRIALWQDPGQAGVVDVDHYSRNVLAGFRVEVEKATKDKVTYAGPLSSQSEARNVAIVRGEWNDAFCFEAQAFPDGAHDDAVDAASLAYLRLSDRPRYAYAPVESASDFSHAKGLI